MITRKAVTFSLILALALSCLWSQEKAMTLSLKDCILAALKNNLGLAVEVLNPELSDSYVNLAEEKFLPYFSMGFTSQNTSSASYSFIEAAEKITNRYNDYSLSVSQLIPTGGRLSASLSSYKNDSNRSFQTINPRYGSTLSFSFSQPLLRNFGVKNTRRDIIIARNNRDISEVQLKSALLDTISNVEHAYWNLVSSVENLKVKNQSLRLAQDLLAKNRREVEVGTLAPIEILNAEAEVASRQADILQAETLVRNSEDLLRTIINLPPEEGRPDAYSIHPSDKPTDEPEEISLEQAIQTALERRPDLEAARLDLKNKEIYLSSTKNQLLPDLSLHASYWSPGISGNQILYQDNDPFTGIIVDVIPVGSSRALKDALQFKYNNWSVSLSLSIPLSYIFSRSALAISKVNLNQALLRLKDQEQQVFLEIRNIVRSVQTDYLRVQAYKAARELAEKKWEAEEKKLKVGLTTNYVVLQHQRDLANARSAELKAIIDYNLSLAALEKALGTTLENKNIQLTDAR